MVRRIIITCIIIAFLFSLYGLFHQIYNALEAGNRLDREVSRLAELQRKNSELKKKLANVETPQFIEQQARDKLNMTREGETIVIIPENELQKVLGMEQKPVEIKLPNWQGWLKLFTR
jgi:cell division protein FtsB